jgi:hypothetical protein
MVAAVFRVGEFAVTLVWITGGELIGTSNGGAVTWAGSGLVTIGLAVAGLADQTASDRLPEPDSGAEEQPANMSNARTAETIPKHLDTPQLCGRKFRTQVLFPARACLCAPIPA